MSFRTTSMAMPRTSICSRLVLTLVLHNLEDPIHHAAIRTERRLDSVPHFPFLESVAAPVGLLHLADRAIQGQCLRFSGVPGRFGAVPRPSFPDHEGSCLFQVVV